jgi:hypothetical protein
MQKMTLASFELRYVRWFLVTNVYVRETEIQIIVTLSFASILNSAKCQETIEEVAKYLLQASSYSFKNINFNGEL